MPDRLYQQLVVERQQHQLCLNVQCVGTEKTPIGLMCSVWVQPRCLVVVRTVGLPALKDGQMGVFSVKGNMRCNIAKIYYRLSDFCRL